jgi:hypothetical protein|tara:strand:+ start:1660 stop:1926 length:267 start_codon:yes stop_codon:yes gene_type:complete
MQIYTASFSKATSAEVLLRFLKAAPKQIPNSPEAFKGQVMEFTLDRHGPVGTLSELHTHLGESDFEIKVGADMVCVTRDDEGNWIQRY